MNAPPSTPPRTLSVAVPWTDATPPTGACCAAILTVVIAASRTAATDLRLTINSAWQSDSSMGNPMAREFMEYSRSNRQRIAPLTQTAVGYTWTVSVGSARQRGGSRHLVNVASGRSVA